MVKSIQLTKNLTVDFEFFQFLLNNSCLVTNVFMSLEFANDLNYIAPSDSNDKITYLPTNKFSEREGFDPFGEGIGRVKVKVGRFINKILPNHIMEKMNISNQDIEVFVNYYKSWFDRSKYHLKVVEGEEIRTWYDEENYYTANGAAIGTLWNSCMRYKKRLKFLDLYCKNPNVKMLVMLQDTDQGQKVRSRALLWESVNVVKDFSNSLQDTIKVMDRIYSVYDSDVLTFKKWAYENDYIPKFEQNAKSHQFFDIKGEVVRIRCNVELSKSDYYYYPYLDTFPFYNYSDGVISNDEYGFSWDYKLVQADGNLERQIEEEEEHHDDW